MADSFKSRNKIGTDVTVEARRDFSRKHRGTASGGKAKADISIYGQELNYTTWRPAKMNLVTRPSYIYGAGNEGLAADQCRQYGASPKGTAHFTQARV